jgi:hypothetical protein
MAAPHRDIIHLRQKGDTASVKGNTASTPILFPPFSHAGILTVSKSGRLYFYDNYKIIGAHISGFDGTDTTSVKVYINETLVTTLTMSSSQTVGGTSLSINVVPGNYAWVESTSAGHSRVTVQFQGSRGTAT